MTIDWQNVISDFNGRWEMCYGCGQKNPIGLKLEFRWDGKGARAQFMPRKEHQGWPGILHGGIMANIIDEAASWALYFEGLYVVTSKMEILYRHPATVKDTLLIESDVILKKKKTFQALTRITTKDGTVIAEGKSIHVNVDHKPELKSKYRFAAIFDMDGVLVDTADFHFRSWCFAFEKVGIEFKRDDFTGLFGQRNDAIIRAVLKREATHEEIDRIAGDKENYFREEVAGHVKAVPGAVELVKELYNAGIKMAIASSAPLENINLLLESLGIKQYFRQFVQGREVTESKPSPLIYLLAARKLGVAPSDCIVFEDAVAGISGAKRAGMNAVALTTTTTRENLKQADMVVDSLAELSVSSLGKLKAKG